MDQLNSKNIVLTPWCNTNECELIVKEKSKEQSKKILEEEGEELLTGSAKTLCIPFEHNHS